MEVINKKGFMFLVSGIVTYTEGDNPEQKTIMIDGLKFLDHEVVWAQDLSDINKVLAMNFATAFPNAVPKNITLISISMLGHCSKEDWTASRDALVESMNKETKEKTE